MIGVVDQPVATQQHRAGFLAAVLEQTELATDLAAGRPVLTITEVAHA